MKQMGWMAVGLAALLVACGGGDRRQAARSSLEELHFRGAVQEVVTCLRAADAAETDGCDRSGRMRFDEAGNLVATEQSLRGELVARSESRYDDGHRLLEKMDYDRSGAVVQIQTLTWQTATDYRSKLRDGEGALLVEETFVREGDRSERTRVTPDGETTLCVTYYDEDGRIERQENTTLAGVMVTEYRYDERTSDPAEQRVLSDGEELARRVMTYDRLDAQGNWTRCVISAVDAQGVRTPLTRVERTITYYH